MTRNEFVKMCGLFGVGLPLQSALTSCSKDPIVQPLDKVIIVGAGAGGLTAAYLLTQAGVDVEILEASDRYGGRMKRTKDFVDFPIPLGAEWLHVKRGVLEEIVNDSSVTINTETTTYDNDVDVALHEGEEITMRQVGFTVDQKFIGSTWFDFYDEYIVPSVVDKISYNKVVTDINYANDQITVSTDSEDFTCDRVIVNAPIKILQSGLINFFPTLPDNQQNALDNLTVWDGCKAFIEFSEKFYPAAVSFEITPEEDGQKLYYDAAYGQNSERHVLGLFAVGTGTLPYVNLSDSELKDYMLAELDDLFDGKASQYYIKHIFQNWNEEPFAKGAYITSHESWREVRKLGRSVDDKLFFAGCSYNTGGTDWSSVHTAARSAIRTVEELLGISL